MTSHRTGQAELVCGLDKLVEQVARVFKRLLHPAFELQDPLPSEVCSSQSLAIII